MDKYLKTLVKELLPIKKEKDMENFLVALFTLQELEMIPKRVAVIQLLKKGLPQRKIAEKLSVGIATVTRGSRELKRKHFPNVK